MIEGHREHLRRRGLAGGTIYKRINRLRTVEERIGLCRATPEDIEELLDGLSGRDEPHLSAKTRYDWISDLACFYRWAIDWGHLEDNPTARLIRPKQRRGLPRPIDDGDLVVALQMAEPTMRAWLTLAAFGGLRVGEIAGLDVDCLLWGDRLIRVLGKGDKERMVPLHPEVERVLRSRSLPSRGPVFRRPQGSRYPAAQVSREGSLFFDSLGIDATMHMLRHWFGTKLYAACRDIRVVQEVMGHATIQTATIYVQWSRSEATKAVESLSVDASPSLLSDWPT